MTTTTFGDEVLAEGQRLKAAGWDANQIAGMLCRKDPQGQNYGIGVLVGRDGKPMGTSSALLEYVEKELRESGTGNYFNSDAVKAQLLEAVLDWQGIPQQWRPHFQLLLPSDAGTGAVQTAIQAAMLLGGEFKTLSVEALGWPAYKAIAAAARLAFHEYPTDGVAEGDGVLPLYQAGPMNTTGRVPSLEMVQNRAQAAKKAGISVVLDRAYPGFEYARRLASGTPYAEIMATSFRQQVLPFCEAGVPFALAISPTKAFVTFALRPCGMLLVFHPDAAKLQSMAPKLLQLIRARGSSFEHPITRAFVKAMTRDRARLEAEHAQALTRNAEAEQQWAALTKGTPLAAQFTEDYAGLFRNPKATPDAPREIYGAHLYPVFTDGRCRLNVTGLPSDPEISARHVAIFAKYCLAG